MTEIPPHVVNVWDLIEDSGVPPEVVQRAFARRRAAAAGVAVPPIPDEDQAFLARHARPVRGARTLLDRRGDRDEA